MTVGSKYLRPFIWLLAVNGCDCCCYFVFTVPVSERTEIPDTWKRRADVQAARRQKTQRELWAETRLVYIEAAHHSFQENLSTSTHHCPVNKTIIPAARYCTFVRWLHLKFHWEQFYIRLAICDLPVLHAKYNQSAFTWYMRRLSNNIYFLAQLCFLF